MLPRMKTWDRSFHCKSAERILLFMEQLLMVHTLPHSKLTRCNRDFRRCTRPTSNMVIFMTKTFSMSLPQIRSTCAILACPDLATIGTHAVEQLVRSFVLSLARVHNSLGYLAPEVAAESYQTCASDMWAAGIIFADLLVDPLPCLKQHSFGYRDLYSAVSVPGHLQLAASNSGYVGVLAMKEAHSHFTIQEIHCPSTLLPLCALFFKTNQNHGQLPLRPSSFCRRSQSQNKMHTRKVTKTLVSHVRPNLALICCLCTK